MPISGTVCKGGKPDPQLRSVFERVLGRGDLGLDPGFLAGFAGGGQLLAELEYAQIVGANLFGHGCAADVCRQISQGTEQFKQQLQRGLAAASIWRARPRLRHRYQQALAASSHWAWYCAWVSRAALRAACSWRAVSSSRLSQGLSIKMLSSNWPCGWDAGSRAVLRAMIVCLQCIGPKLRRLCSPAPPADRGRQAPKRRAHVQLSRPAAGLSALLDRTGPAGDGHLFAARHSQLACRHRFGDG